MAKAKGATREKGMFDLQDVLATAPCVPALREAVAAWRAGGYKEVTDTTKELLGYWFHPDGHKLPNGSRFRYHLAQREAIETLIYVYEVRKVRTRKALLEEFAFNSKNLRLPPFDEFARYCVKMATGSGKTKVMALTVAWHYFNAVRESDTEFARNFMIFAPNVIVFERLQSDFGGGRIFRTDPMFPKHYQMFWDLECYMRGDGERASSQGALYLSNIQQFHERTRRTKKVEPEELTAMLGPDPQKITTGGNDFQGQLAKRTGLLLVLNDEGHHTHDENSEWNEVIRQFHARRPIASQVDFSATPRYSKGGLFAWTISDYPLKQAIKDNIVKRPVKGISKIEETKSNVSHVKYEGFLTAGVERWKEYRDQLHPLQKKPILFVMMNSTEEADDVGDWLQRKYPSEFGAAKTLIIHTDTAGEVSKADLDKARKLARDVDENTSAVNAIVSVLMLREGWDVQNVTVVVGLRPYSSKANILPEQTIGRGLRLMFKGGASGYVERVDVIGNKAFLSFVEDLEKLEGLKLDTFEIGKDKLRIVTIMPVEGKNGVDIGIPELTPALVRKKSLAEEIAALDVMAFKGTPLPLKGDKKEIKTFIYEGRDLLTDEKLLEREYTIPPAQTSQEVIGYYARRISQDVKLPAQFAALVPKLREFFEEKAFGKHTELDNPAVIQAMSSNLASYVVTREFEKALREIVVEDKTPELIAPAKMLSSTTPFPYSNEVLEAKKSIFNYVACDNKLEYSFAKFLEGAEDVVAFAKLPEQFGFSIEYPDSLSNIRNYFPDFIARLTDGSHWVIETKGREDIEVKRKDEAATRWCENATELTKTEWKYLKVRQKEYEVLNPSTFEELHGGLGLL